MQRKIKNQILNLNVRGIKSLIFYLTKFVTLLLIKLNEEKKLKIITKMKEKKRKKVHKLTKKSDFYIIFKSLTLAHK